MTETAETAPVHPLLSAPVSPTLAKLAAPNLLGMLASTSVSIAETAYIGRLGAEPLAAAARDRAEALARHGAVIGLGLGLFFSIALSLFGKGVFSLLGGTAGLAVAAIGGVILVKTQGPSWALFALMALGMVTMGAMTAGFVALTPWGPRPLKP